MFPRKWIAGLTVAAGAAIGTAAEPSKPTDAPKVYAANWGKLPAAERAKAVQEMKFLVGDCPVSPPRQQGANRLSCWPLAGAAG